jgi:hypothetical protein
LSTASGYTDFSFKDFYFEAEVQLLGEANKSTAAGLLFRGSTSRVGTTNKASYYVFLVSPDGKFGLWSFFYDILDNGSAANTFGRDITGEEKKARVEGSLLMFCSVNSKHIKQGKAKNVIAVACVENTILCYINNHFVFSCKDNDCKIGTAGFYVQLGDNAYAFDNFKVYEAFLPGK